MQTAKFIRDIASRNINGSAIKKLYQLGDGNYVIASAVDAPDSGPEVLIFPSNEDGTITTFREVNGMRGTMDIDAVMNKFYDVIK